MKLNHIKEETKEVMLEVLKLSRIKDGGLLVLGCSSSAVLGEHLGTHSSFEIAEAVYSGVKESLKDRDISLAVQCCEHLNRAIVIEKEDADKYGFEEVNVVPQLKAGGSFATTYYRDCKNPVVVENIKAMADAGVDIGGVLIGMHVKPVVVPLHLDKNRIGEGVVIAARRRAKYVGGERAAYNPDLE